MVKDSWKYQKLKVSGGKEKTIFNQLESENPLKSLKKKIKTIRIFENWLAVKVEVETLNLGSTESDTNALPVLPF